MGRNRPSNEDAPRVPGSEGGPPWGRIIAALIGLLLLALLIPLACQALRGDDGSGAQDPGTQEKANPQEKDDEQGGAGGTAGGKDRETTGGGSSSSGGSRGAAAGEQEPADADAAAAGDDEPDAKSRAQGEELPESGGVPSNILPALGAAMTLVGSSLLRGISARRR